MNKPPSSHWARSKWAPGERRLHWHVLPTPYVTFSYAHGEGDAEPTIGALEEPSLQLPPFRVSSAWLLDVARKPARSTGGTRGTSSAKSRSTTKHRRSDR